MIQKRLLASILACASILTIQGQQLQASLSHFSTDDGLTSNAISGIYQDDYGYLWVATWNGLSRFDGFNFYNYKTGNASHIKNLHNRILDLAIDQSQNVWMQMYDGRVFVMNRTTDKIINPFEGIAGYEEFRTNSPILVTTTGDVIPCCYDKEHAYAYGNIMEHTLAELFASPKAQAFRRAAWIEQPGICKECYK
jgi:ligand-binding sensor domain-containing protein